MMGSSGRGWVFRAMNAAMLAGLVACGGRASDAGEAAVSSAEEVNAGGVWAGKPSITIERYAADPCDEGQYALGDEAVGYDEWARERAAIRNVCFEVWKAGVTDRDDPDYWRELDVQVHYRFVGPSGAGGDRGPGSGADASPFSQAYVSSIDRRGNNRRYAWALDIGLDPFLMTPTLPDISVPFEIASESDDSASVTATLEFYFTVNGQVLDSPRNAPFKVKYEGYARKAKLAPKDGGHVLYPRVTCANDAVRFGDGAGYLAADVRDRTAVAALAAGLDRGDAYGSAVGVSGAGATRIFSVLFGSITNVPGQALPGFADGLYASHQDAVATPDGDRMRLTLRTYDRTAKLTRELSTTFDGCVASGAR
jgi:hypothetical protein